MELSQVFIKILNMSLTASYCIIAIILLRLLLSKQSKLLSYLLWSVVLFRLICPFSLSSSYSLLRMDTDIISQENVSRWSGSNIVGEEQDKVVNNGMQILQTQANEEDANASANFDYKKIDESDWIETSWMLQGAIQRAFDIAAKIWIAGIVLLVSYSIVTMLRLRQSLKSAVLIEKNIYEAENIDTPFVFGMIKPRIYLPAYIKEEEKRYVLEHEKIHIARKDYLVKILAYAAACLHWFNPLVWIGFALMENDMEMSCDEAVLRKMGENVKKEYSMSLLSLSCERTLLQGSPLAFGEVKVKGRVQNILSYRKKALITVVLTATALVTIGAGLSLNPTQDDLPENETETEMPDSDSEEPKLDNQQSGPETSQLDNSDSENVALAEFVENFAVAVCNRDGDAIASMYIDEDTALVNEENMLLEKAGDGYTYGYSSPWPIDFRLYINWDEQTADIWYYAWTSDPHISVWKQEVQYTLVGEEYKVVKSSIDFLNNISSKEEFDNAYLVNNEYYFVDYEELGFVDAIKYQIEAAENFAMDNTVYFRPETAAAHILGLTGGVGIVVGDYTSEATVRYTFADGSEVVIPMYNPVAEQTNSNEEGGSSQGQDVWIVDTEAWGNFNLFVF